MTSDPPASSDQALVVVDSSALVALISQTDAHHQRAEAMSERLELLGVTVITPADVFAETINVVGKRFGHTTALELAKVILDSDLFLIEETDSPIRLAALQRFERQPGSVSFTDCVVMAIADRFETTDIFGFDQAFTTNGYHLPTREDWPAAA